MSIGIGTGIGLNRVAANSTPTPPWSPNTDWWDIEAIVQSPENNEYPNRVIYLLPDLDLQTFVSSGNNCVAFKTSDGEYNNNISTTGGATHVWDLSKDKPVTGENYKTRWVICYFDGNPRTVANNVKNPLYAVGYNVSPTTVSFNSEYLLQAVKLLNQTDPVNKINFMSCANLVYVPESFIMTSLTSQPVFQGCINLVECHLTTDPSVYQSLSMVNAFNSCASLKTCIIKGQFISALQMFTSCRSLEVLPTIDYTGIINAKQMFSYCSSLKSANITFPAATDLSLLFSNCSELRSATIIAPFVQNISYAFQNCTSLQRLPSVEKNGVASAESYLMGSGITGNVNLVVDGTSFNSFLRECLNVETATINFTSNDPIILQYFFNGNNLMKRVDLVNLSTGTVNLTGSTVSIFNQCTSLLKINGELDFSAVTSCSSAFAVCRSLISVKIKNLGVEADFSQCPLSLDSVKYLTTNLQTVTTTVRLNLGSANLAKLTDDEKAVITAKGWTLV